jgi:hypothetical protein
MGNWALFFARFIVYTLTKNRINRENGGERESRRGLLAPAQPAISHFILFVAVLYQKQELSLLLMVRFLSVAISTIKLTRVLPTHSFPVGLYGRVFVIFRREGGIWM